MELPTLGALLALSTLASTDAPPLPAQEWRIDGLDLVLTVEPAEQRLRVEGEMRVRLQDAESSRLVLELNSRKDAMQFRSATALGVEARLTRQAQGPAEWAAFDLPRRVQPGEVVTVAFALESATTSSQLQMGAQAFYGSWVEQWYPLPARAGRESGSPAAPGSTTFRLPPGWRAVSNGSLESTTTDGGRVVERWQSAAPVARSFVAAPFLPAKVVNAGARPIAFHLLRPRATSDGQAAALAGALRAMEGRFGPYPYASYHVVEVPETASFAAGSEQGFIMVRSSVLDDVRGTVPLFAHEAAHGWWGNLVRSEGPGAKTLSEALAQYGAVVSIEALEGTAARDEFLRFSRPGYNPLQCALGYFHIWREGGDAPLASLEDAPSHHNLSDSKGMWFHHMLRLRLGDERFFAALRALVRDFADEPIDLPRFREQLLAVDDSLAPFLGQWLDRTGAPVLRVEWWSIDRGKAVEIDVQQLQAGEPFQVPLEIGLVTSGGETVRQTLALTARRQRFTAAVPSRALDLMVDPDTRLLVWRPEYGPRPGQEEPAR